MSNTINIKYLNKAYIWFKSLTKPTCTYFTFPLSCLYFIDAQRFLWFVFLWYVCPQERPSIRNTFKTISDGFLDIIWQNSIITDVMHIFAKHKKRVHDWYSNLTDDLIYFYHECLQVFLLNRKIVVFIE